jgi:hypothetical protein
VPPGEVAGVVAVHLPGDEGQRLLCLRQAVPGLWPALPAGVGGGQDTGDEVPLKVVVGVVAAAVEQFADVVAGPVGVTDEGEGKRGGQPAGEDAVGMLAQVGEQLAPPGRRRPGAGSLQVVGALGSGDVVQV